MKGIKKLFTEDLAQGMTEYILVVFLAMLPFVEIVRILYKMVYDEFKIISLFVNLPFP